MRSVLAVVAGFLVMAVIVMIGTAVAARVILRQPLSTIRTGSSEPLPLEYLAANLSASAIAALCGGFLTAAIAGRSPLAHGLALAVVIVLMSILSMKQAGASQPRWYQLTLATAMPALALTGAFIRAMLTPVPAP